MSTVHQSSLRLEYSASSYFEEEGFQDNTDEEKSPSRPLESPIYDDDNSTRNNRVDSDTPVVVSIVNRDSKQCGDGDDDSTINRSERTDSDETIILEDLSREFSTHNQYTPYLPDPIPSSSSRQNSSDIPPADTAVSPEDPISIEPTTLQEPERSFTSISTNNNFALSAPSYQPQQMHQLRQSPLSNNKSDLSLNPSNQPCTEDQTTWKNTTLNKQALLLQEQLPTVHALSDSIHQLSTAKSISTTQTSLASLSTPTQIKQSIAANNGSAAIQQSQNHNIKYGASSLIPVNIMIGFRGSTSEIITNILYRQSELRVCVIGRNLFDVVTPTGCSSYPLKPDVVSSLVDIISRQHNSSKLDAIFLDLAGMSLNMGSLFAAIKKNDLTNSNVRIFNVMSLFEVSLESAYPGTFAKMAELVAVSDHVLLHSSSTGLKDKSSSQYQGVTEKIAQITHSINPFISTNSITTSSFLAHAMERQIDYEKLCTIDLSFLRPKVHVSNLTSIRCISITIHGDMHVIRFNKFMNPFYTSRALNIFKCFGYLAFDVAVQGPEDKFAFIGIRKELTVVRTRATFQVNEPRKSIIILICSRDLDYHELVRGLKSCLVKADTKIDVIL